MFECIEKTIKLDFKKELEFIANYDITKKSIQEIVDMPDKLIHLMIKFVCQHHGHLSKNKRDQYFLMLTDKEIENLETVIRDSLLKKH